MCTKEMIYINVRHDTIITKAHSTITPLKSMIHVTCKGNVAFQKKTDDLSSKSVIILILTGGSVYVEGSDFMLFCGGTMHALHKNKFLIYIFE